MTLLCIRLVRERKITSAIIGLGIICWTSIGTGQSLPSWVGGVGPTWTPLLGGGVWYESVSEITNVRSALVTYSRPVLAGLRGDSREQGYRFDLNMWDTNDPNWPNYNYFATAGGPASQEFVMSNWDTTGNVKFIWSMPTPNPSMLVANPYSEIIATSNGGYSYPWQTADYYAAYLQYLIEPPSMSSNQYSRLSLNYDFTTNSEAAVGTNWGNLRAARGHPAPYTNLQAVILGVEPYTQANESFLSNVFVTNGSTVTTNVVPWGAGYGAVVEAYRNAIRARAVSTNDPMATIALGICMEGNHPLDDFTSDSPWFKPLMDAVSNNLTDFSYIDSYHEYPGSTGDIENAPTRLFSVMTNSSGYQNYWCGAPEWQVDFTHSLWWYDDIHAALRDYASLTGLANSNTFATNWNIGCAEHGLAIETDFDALDMNAGLYWALWLAEIMRYHANWDMSWVLCDPGNSSTQLQFNGTNLTLTPAYYVYKMAQEFSGLQYVTNTLADNLFDPMSLYFATNSSEYSNCTEVIGYETAPEATVRLFYDPASGDYHMFVINENASTNAVIAGWSNWCVSSWEKLQGSNYFDSNNFAVPDNHLHTSNYFGFTNGQPLSIPPISVNHIVLSSNWLETSSMITARYLHTATLLTNGLVLVAGGYGASGALTSAELYNPITGTWEATGSLNTARYAHTATLLTNGQVLVAGGNNSSGFVSSSELYDPNTGTWALTSGSLIEARGSHTAILLTNGWVLVVAGAVSCCDGYTASAELYDPGTETWTQAGSLNTSRMYNTTTLLPNGDGVVAGGYQSGPLASAEVYLPGDPGDWTGTESLNTARYLHTATLLTNGLVLVAGGEGIDGPITNAELYTPSEWAWARTGSLNTARYWHTATLLPNGLTLVAGGYGLPGGIFTNTGYLTSAELYNASAGQWTVTASLHIARFVHTATLLSNGWVLVAGGYGTNGEAIGSAELYPY